MNVGDRSKRWLRSRPTIEFPREFLAERQHEQQREFPKHIVRMLMVDQRRAVVGLAGLEEFRKARMWRGQRFGGQHLAEQNRARTELVLFHQHPPVDGLSLA